MPLPAPVLDPPFNITRVSHVVLTSHDLDASQRFYSDVLGLVVSDSDKDALYLEVGTRSKGERVHYPGVDFRMERDGTSRRWMRKDGTPIKE